MIRLKEDNIEIIPRFFCELRDFFVILPPELGTRASSPVSLADKNDRAPRQTVVVTVRYIEA